MCFYRSASPGRPGGFLTKMLRGMKITAILLLLGCLQVSASAVSQTITYSGKEASLATIISVIEKQTGYLVFASKKQIEQAKPVTIEARQMPMEVFLKKVLDDGPLEFSIEGNTISIKLKKDPAPPKEKSAPPVSGRIIDANNQPLADVSIRIRGTRKGTTSGADGQFSLEVNEGDVLDISAVGFQPIAMRLNGDLFRVVPVDRPARNQQPGSAEDNSQLLRAGKQNVSIKLIRASAVLDEAVIYNGYQKIKQKYLTGSVTSLKMDSVMQPGLNTVDKMLEGRVPGLTFMQNSGQSGAAPKLRIRGTSTILGSREPLWVVDGIIRTNPIPIPADRINDPDFVNLLGNAISGLNPYDIDQIDVLKDATAAALYGVRAANGVIVITTKRGKPGPPTVNYNVTGTFTRRPRYSDRSIYMMDSRERVDVSREMIEKQMLLRGSGIEAYEKAILDYYDGNIDYATFKQRVDRAETINTDWMGNTMRDVFASNHTLSVSGGTHSASYRASIGYNTEPGVIKKESNDRYTSSMNLLLNYKKFRADLIVQLNQGKRRYTPQEIGLLNYAYGTSRAIPLYNEDGSLYYYSTVGSNFSNTFYDFKTMNIINEMDHTGETVRTNEYIASANLSYEISKGIQFNSTLAYTGGNADHETWFEEKTEWAAKIRNPSYSPIQGTFQPRRNLLPFGGELRQQTVRRQNYTINGRLDISKFLDRQKKHQLTSAIGTELISNRNNSFDHISRGYYPDRGQSFANIDLTTYTSFATWLQQNGAGIIRNELQNSIRTFLTSTYIFNERYVITATTSQEYSNAFGSRSNEKFLPTWALSGRWNLQEDLLRKLSWVDFAALKFSYGTQGNMLPGQSPNAVIQKGTLDSYYEAFGSSIVSFSNPDLSWEKKLDYNGNIEFSILQGRISGSLGYFYSKTNNAFLEKKVSLMNGVRSYVVNGGTVENQGVEIDLHFKVINNKRTGNKNGFLWRFDPQLGQVFNRLINNNLKSRNVLVDEAALTYANFLNGSVPINGKAVNTFYSYRFKTLDPSYGFPVFYGAENENAAALLTKYNKMTKDQVYNAVMVESGRREPVLQGGISNSFVYRNWSLSFTLTYSLGNKVRLLQIASGNYGTFRPSSQQNIRKEFVNRWRYPGDEQFTNIPAINGASSNNQPYQYGWWGSGLPVRLNTIFATDYYQMYDFSDLRVVKGDYLKLQYLSLSYMLPREICSQWHIKGATVQLTGSNLFTIANKALHGQDPSQSGSAPNINLSIRPVYAINFNLNF
ncbi:TonB-linked SusC/RagA family outer membrane protein [Pseudobacter ginsenosidimutans]|uniref:TonB-linked SusC/RagA family outer membrane protein n=2 Tax=Pseudobacter ginsenosidimutans TaxID=661488 RepID=A0A4V2F2B0_9BACT|nr:SusC/RagA family TonB-linked outer membrane protein [Pseudobacter ginsenosidimutans]RZS76647.1 TonB-linked SusC/RagA family outer membrane protein [Pseudobacter ginsenosidimutans]